LHVDGPIAQLVEQLAFNQWVAGSSPARLNSIRIQSLLVRESLSATIASGVVVTFILTLIGTLLIAVHIVKD
jgi:hypothetical protein